MPSPGPLLSDLILPPWDTNARVTAELIGALPAGIFLAAVPGSPRRTVASIALHLHNARCRWLRTLAEPLGVPVPRLLGPAWEGKPAMLRALRASASGMAALLALGCKHGGRVPATSRYVWRNLALDVGHVLTYFVAHEAHHRGQLLTVARQLGHPLPKAAAGALWWWKPPRGKRPVDRRNG